MAKTPELKGEYRAPSINMRLFGNDLALANTERQEYATNLGAYVVNIIQASKGDQASLDRARRILGLALHLSPRNKKCVVINAQLKRGLMPDNVVADYEPNVFAKLLLTRAQLLEKQEGATNEQLARYFIELAADINPRNEDAVYESEIRKIDKGALSWETLTDGKKALTHQQ
ncbi:MAG: hypothetical protein ACPG6P_03015 [Akkermansiaceae bacterium]